VLKIPDRYDDENKVVHEVVLVKKVGMHGDLHVGRKYQWTYKHLPRHIAIHKAFESLVRDHPDEARADWMVDSDV
jgi:hypothetical protein